jgi:ATP-binding cassette, subfamily C, bacterial
VTITPQAAQGSALRGTPRAPALAMGLRTIRPTIITAVVFSLFINILMFVSPLYMLQIYDRVLSSRSQTTLIAITVIAGLMLLVYAVLESLRTHILVRAGLLFDQVIASAAFNAIHRGLLKRPGTNLVQGLRDVDSLREFLTGSGLLAFCDAPWFPVFVFASFLLHPWFGWIAIVGSVVIWTLTLINEVITKKELNEASSASIEAGQRANTTFRNVEVLQAMGMLGALRTLWLGMHQKHLGWQARASDRAGLLLAGTKFFRAFLQIIILGTGGYLAINQEISPGGIVAASILIGRALQPMEVAVASWKGFVNARGAYRRLSQLFAVAGQEPERMPLPAPLGALSVENVLAGAPGQREAILKGISFALTPGEILCVVGPSAAGKSTLARVIVGVWSAAQGAVRVDGSDLSHWDAQQLGRHIGYLPQDVELFAGTVAQNIGRFGENIDSEHVIAAAEQAGCHELIQHFSEGYNTQIGDGGMALSGGQRQRVALARALYGEPSLIVLDEPNSNLDSAGEEALLRAIQGLKARGKTAILITHKVNVLAVADKILVMANGQVQSFGPRDEILARLLGPRVVPAAAPPAVPAEPSPAAMIVTGAPR